MDSKFACLILALIIITWCCEAPASGDLSEMNPDVFRKSLHQEYKTKSAPNNIVIPEIIPQAPPLFWKATNSFNDFLISETVGPANFRQDKADICEIKGSGMAAVWEDNRLGPISVFLQLFSTDGTTIGNNIPLIHGENFNVNDPHICSDNIGNFYVVWREDVNGFLQAARLDQSANIVTAVFFVSDTIMSSFAGEFDAECLPDGRLVVAWEDYSVGNDIALRIFNTDGTPASAIITVNSDGPFNQHWSPSLAISGTGDIALAWEDYRTGVADIFYRRFNSSGIPQGTEISLSDDHVRDSARFLPSIIYSPINGYVAGWVDLRDGQNIYLQQITASSQLNGSNLLLTAETSEFSNWEIDLGVNSANHLLAAWTLFGDENSILLQRFLPDMQLDGPAQAVSGSGDKQRFMPTVAGNMAGNMGVVWTDLASGSIDVLAAVIANDGNIVVESSPINDDTVGSPSIQPQVTRFDRFEWDIVFTDMRRDGGDIMLQRLYVGGELVGNNRLINTDPPGGVQSQPAIAASSGRLVISWTDVRSNSVTGQNIFCRFSNAISEITPEMVVNDDNPGLAGHYNSDCAINADGITLVVWTDTRTGNAKIFGQRYDDAHNPAGDNFQIGPSAVAEIGEMAMVSADSNGSFVVAYLNRLNPAGPAVEIKLIDVSGQISGIAAFASDQNDYQIDGFDAGVGGDGTVSLAWHGFDAGSTELFVTTFDQSGSVLRPTQQITDHESAMPGMPDASIDNLGYLLVTWLDNRTGQKTPFRQIYDASLNPIEGNVPTFSDAGSYMQPPVTDGFRGRGIFAWADARANGLNIYTSQELYEPTDADDDNEQLPALFSLEQNYPNPFNPSTVIDFSLRQAGSIRLDVLNLLGQKVRTLIDGTRPAGNHSIVWDGTSDGGKKVASGIYLYRLKSSDFIRTRKMVLTK
jgi:hypothetical protein